MAASWRPAKFYLFITRRAGVPNNSQSRSLPNEEQYKTLGKRKSRGQRTQVHLTMWNLKSKMFPWLMCLGLSRISLSYDKSCLGLHLNIANDCEISEFHRLNFCWKVWNICYFSFLNFGNFKFWRKIMVWERVAALVPQAETRLTVYRSLPWRVIPKH